jgi:LysM repeat protein
VGSEKKLIHTVQQGDSLYDIAKRYNTSVAQVRVWNGLKGTLLHPGDTLLIFIPR